MATLSISLPDQLISQLDAALATGGFSTRSEYIRNLLRTNLPEPKIDIFSKKPINEIKLNLAQTGKYSQEFIESVTRGLSKSSPYEN
jgi:Arc/MetJ-type ribon-helix-helix transcriptional regulator